ncbi:aldose 1-epimerase family protein [Sulfitobacter donghicola]|uniref:Aldose epimerase n=1 Tax=Sulfitobacter donghicola DSW-25 = KCTC 12864 = JCM 14565 TaxID=1300350 RepID=A0A073IL20_9RHOB|nr:aldose 1-epimerase family protein [Sulfitobacter donghicola]KEJ90285.1 aldose epimerase [Sulfitobacter donghicola DSW-25 = KCTC 12864 = JCM 14565]KIN66541.1 Aldose 1-epimerase [Sulfitobacter donghicola DSW-25 = KCTC 12864 = JCM 14565]
MSSDLTTLQNDHLILAVASMGAEMQYLRTAAGDELLWHGDGAFWTGRAPVLFPIVGRAVDDQIAVGDHSSALPQHGFARRNLFELVEQSDTMCHHVLTDTPETHAAYPFAFSLSLTHRIEGATLHVEARVTNNDAQPMPFGFGFHPAFCWPLPNADGHPHHVTLASGGAPDLRAIDEGLLRPEPLAGPFVDGDLEIAEHLFDDGALVFPNGTDSLRYGPKSGTALAFTFHNLPDLALWRPTGAPFLCIEPWHGTASYVGDGPQIGARPNSITLPSHQSVAFGYSVTVEG